MNQIELKALAKINLGLDVLGRRENGYHDVRMVMQSIYLYDEVKIVKKKEPGITLTTNLKFLPTGDGNIAYKAAQLLVQGDQGAAGLLRRPQTGLVHQGTLQTGASEGRHELFKPLFRASLQRASVPETHLLPLPDQDNKGA